MEKKDIQLTLILFFAAGSFVLLALYGFWHFNPNDASKGTLPETEETASKLIYNDVLQTYTVFKEFTPSWNHYYARLTLNEARDSVVDPKYTVKEFGLKHQDIIKMQYDLEKQLLIWEPLPLEYIVKAHHLNRDTKHLFGTYGFRDAFFELAQDLEQAFVNIVNHHKPTDTVATSVYDENQKFSSYFRILERMDRIFFDMMVTRYPRDLEFVTNVSPERIETAQLRALDRHVFELRNRHDWEKNKSEYSLDSGIKICNAPKGQFTTYLVKNNGEKMLSLIKTERDLSRLTPEEKQIALQDLVQCTEAFMSDVEEDNHYYISTPNETFFTTNKAQFRPWSETGPEPMMSFYADENGRYYILAGYDAFKVFYPNLDKATRTRQRTEHATDMP
ncbi:hypothetical protein [Maribacter sp. 2307ULW6-5]|uniref:hypothetical protein n=1 Tax=Maribacter sp. 2307ULW6-5 TaxID=3386275 RepID=UPI0039BCB5FE